MREVGAVYPGARVIHIGRDGRDRTVSSMHRGWRRADQGLHRLSPEELARGKALRAGRPEPSGAFTEEWLRQAARHWRLLVGRAAEDGPALLGSDYTEVRYEDLLDRPNEGGREVARLPGGRHRREAGRALRELRRASRSSPGGASGVRRTPPPTIGKALRVTGGTTFQRRTGASSKRRPGSS